MSRVSKIAYSVKSLFLKKKLDEQMNDEIRIHLEIETEAKVAAGMSAEEARYAALREFGNVASVQERSREERGWLWCEQWVRDFAFVLRSLARARWFSLTMLATLVVGLSVAAVTLSMTEWILFRPAPFPEPDRLFYLDSMDKTGAKQNGCFGLQFRAYQEQTRVFSRLAALEQSQAVLVRDGAPSVIWLHLVSADFFPALGVKPALGRGFTAEEYRDGGSSNAVMLSNNYWREKFQASPDVLGREVRIDQRSCTIVGVLPVIYNLAVGDIYRPLALKLDPAEPFVPWLTVIGRLKPGVTREQAAAVLASVKLGELPPWANSLFAERRTMLTGMFSVFDATPYWLMFAGGILLFGSACLNAMNLMVARLLGRQRELGIRQALGGSRWQVARLLAIESMGLAVGAGLMVWLGWYWISPLFSALFSGSEIKTEGNWWNFTWGFSAVVPLILGVVAGVIVATVPVWRVLRSGVNASMKEGGMAYGESRRMMRLRNGLVVLQAAFAVILLVGMGLMVHSFARLHRVDLGFAPAGKVIVQLAFPRDFELKPEARLRLFEELSARLTLVPGVKEVTYAQSGLLEGEWGSEELKLPDGTVQTIGGYMVADNFAQVVGLSLVRGRWFSHSTNVNDAAPEVVINETAAKKLFGRDDPIGKTVPSRQWRVVGVVHNLKGAVREAVGSHYYLTARTFPISLRTLILSVQSDRPQEFAGLILRTLYAIEPRLIMSSVQSVDEHVLSLMWSERFAYSILKGMTPLALVLAVVGLFSVLAYNVQTRTGEFGLRLALGATPKDLHRLVLSRGVGTAAIGVVVGLAVAIGLTRFMQSLLFETAPYDPLVLAGVGLVLLSAAGLACWLPARRAAKVDPVIALRSE